MYDIRPAQPGDHRRISPVMDGWWGREVRAMLPRLFLDHFHRTSFVAERGSELAGFLVGLLSPSIPDLAYIHFVGVDPASRGTGLGRELYRRFFALALEDGRERVRAVTSPQNTGSIAFHRAMGFSVTGPVADYDGPGTSRMVFERSLRRPGEPEPTAEYVRSPGRSRLAGAFRRRS
jgi:ribosomal protein S18 acetylase RimI-like enzyme